MNPFEATSGHTSAPDAETYKPPRSTGGAAIALLLVLLFAALVIMDYSDIVFADSRRQAALDLIKPGMRLTQAERTLNGAGYMTLYVDENPPWVQVSFLNRWPLSAVLLHRTLPNSAADDWLRNRLSGLTRFYVAGKPDGTVKFSSAGEPAFSRSLQGGILTSKSW